MRMFSGLRLGALAGAVIVAGSTVAVSRLVLARDGAPGFTKVNLTVSDSEVLRDGRFTTSFSPIVKKVIKSVVKVEVKTNGKTVTEPGEPFGQFGGDEFFRRFFGQQFGQNGGTREFRTPAQHGLGSGVVVSADGYILTNNHVVDGADDIKVSLNDGREFTAKVVGRDPKTDIAIVKIAASDLPFITIADSDKIEVGDVCLAVGNPFGIGETVTMGIVSATGRGGVGTGTDYEDYIQTDAAINPGNSGGALVDAEGRLIGINTAILSHTGGYQGIGFAVPVNLARTVMTDLISDGRVVRGYLGVYIQDVTPALAKQFDLKDDHGALIGEVSPNGPAAKAGFESGDVVTEFNHHDVADSRRLKLQVAETAPGSHVPVTVLRDGKTVTLTVTVKELPGETTAKADSGDGNSSDTLNGVTVGDLDGQTRSQLGVPEDVKGAVVTAVEQDSASYEAGLRQGDVIQEINRKPVENGDAAVKLSGEIKDPNVLLKVWSKNGDAGASHYVVVEEGKKNG